MGSPGQGNQRFTVILKWLTCFMSFYFRFSGLLSSYCPFISSVSHCTSQVPTLIPLRKSPFPLLLLRSLAEFLAFSWQVPLWPQWSKLHLRLSPKHMSPSGTEWSQLPERNQDSSAGTRGAYASLKYMAKMWINAGFTRQERRQAKNSIHTPEAFIFVDDHTLFF